MGRRKQATPLGWFSWIILALETKRKFEEAETLSKLDSSIGGASTASTSTSRNGSNISTVFEIDRKSELPPQQVTATPPTTLPPLINTRESSWMPSDKVSFIKKNSSRSSTTTTSSVNSISSSPQDEDYKKVKLANFWRISFLLLQSLIFAVSARKCFFAAEQETYWFLAFLERLSCSLMDLLAIFIVASNPFSDCKIMEIISVAMLLLSRISLLLSDEKNYAKAEIDTNASFQAGMLEVAEYVYFSFWALRYKKLLMKEPVSTSRTLIFNTLPKTIFSTIISMAYMNSDSIECVLSNKDKLVTPT